MEELQNIINLSFKNETQQFHVTAAKRISELAQEHWYYPNRHLFYAHVKNRKLEARENELIHYGRFLSMLLTFDHLDLQHLYEKTIISVRNSAVALIVCCKKRKKQIPRDVALLIAHMVWDSKMDAETINK